MRNLTRLSMIARSDSLTGILTVRRPSSPAVIETSLALSLGSELDGRR
ncbi:MAG: hypothetical protein H0V59_01575 [Nocardioidaceae bacterium]|nr:hypothetical protein [Nocardioidaceae bacterium]